MAFRTFIGLCAVLLVWSCFFSGVHGHGFLATPKSRNYLANLAGQEYCHQCLSAGGPSTVQGLTPGGQYPTPTETLTSSVRHTMCGESAALAASSRHYNPYPAPAVSALPVYTPGAEIDIRVVITAHHRGHFEFRLCDAAKLSDPTTVTWACLDQHLLQRVSVPGEISPVDVNHPERYYLEPECATGYNNQNISMKYRIPSNVTCERCIMQWWWVSANSCNPPGYAARSPAPSYPAGCVWWSPTLTACGTSYPEEFWNCADLRIAGTASPPGVMTSPPPPATAPKAPVAPPAVPKAPTAPPAAPKAPPAAPKAPPAAPKAAPKAPLAAPKAPPAAPKAAPAAPKVAPSAAPKAPAAPTSTCAPLGTQCGGDGWTGPTCCASGAQCYAYISTYSQCRNDGCPAGWICSKPAGKSLVTAAVEWAKSLVE